MSKTQITFIITLLVTITSFAQNGINYKVIVKDDSGNILASSPVTIQFFIYDGNQNSIYEESHSTSTDANGLIIANIGEGAVGDGDFTTIDWENDDYYLNVQIDIGAGFVDFGFTQFKAVPYALSAGNVTGLEAIDEGNGIGWRLKGRDPSNHGTIGENAMDLGNFTTASGLNAIATGTSTIASGNFSTAMGNNTTAPSFAETALGWYNTEYNPNSAVAWSPTDRLFVIGNGTSAGTRNDALTILKNGSHTINSDSDGLLINAGNTSNDDGILINTPGGDGIFIYAPGDNGISVLSASNYGGAFRGFESGVHATAINDDKPDIILGSQSGYISSAPQVTGSDLLLNANGNIELKINESNTIGQTSLFIRNGETNDVVFSVSENGQVNTQGRLLVNTSVDASLSPVSGSVLIGDFFSTNIIMDDNEIMARNNYQISPLYLQRDGGNVSIGNVGVPNVALDVQGSIQYTGSITDVSDKRLKENFEPIINPLERLQNITGYSYNMIDDDEKTREYGVIAQDVQKVFPEMVTVVDEESGHLGVSYNQLIPVLLEAIKEQNKRIDELEARLDSQTDIAKKD